MSDTTEKELRFDLFKEIKNFPTEKKVEWNKKEVTLHQIISDIYDLFSENKCVPISVLDLVEKSFGSKLAERAIDKVVRRHLSSPITSPKLVQLVKTKSRKYSIYPLALVLKIEANESDENEVEKKWQKIYDFTLIDGFNDFLEKFSERITLDICTDKIPLKNFFECYSKENPVTILRILISISKNLKQSRPEYYYDSQDKLKAEVSLQLEEYQKHTSVTPLPIPEYLTEIKQFVTENRAEELENALIYLKKHRILFLSGVGGVGKSTLARALVDRRPTYIPEPFWINFDHNQDAKLGDILEKLALYLNAPDIAAFKEDKRKPGDNDVDKLVCELYRKSEVWLVFDNLETVLEDQNFADEGIELLFSSLRYQTHNAKVIVTSRILPKLKKGDSFVDVNRGEKKYHLGGLSTNFAVDYLASHELNELESEKLEKLAIGVGGHPLALKLLVELVKEFGVKDTLEDLSMYQESKDDTIKKARKLFDKLAGGEKELLERISVYRRPVDMKGLKEMFIENTPKNAIKKLIEKSLLENDRNGNYWLHPLVQEFSYDDLVNKNEAHKTAYIYYSSLLLPENPSKKEDLQPSIEAHYHACEAGEYDLAAQMILLRSKLHISLNNWGDYTTLEEMYRRLLPKEHFKGKALLSDKKMENLVFGKLGNVYLQLGKVDIALNYYKQALKITREIGEKREEIDLFINMGTSYRYQGELEKEIDCYKQALEIARDIGDPYEETYILAKLGYVFYYWGDIQKEIERYESAIKNAEKRGDEERCGELLALLGTVYSNQGKHKEAIENCEKAVEIAEKFNIRRLQEDCHGYLGFAYRCSGNLKNLDKALEHYKKALDIAKKINDRIGEGRRCGSIGIVYSIQGQTKEAIKQYEIALEIAKETNDSGGKGKWLGCMGLAYSDLKEDNEAIEYYEQALKVCKKSGYRRGECEETGFKGNALSDLGKYEEAINQYKEALEVAKEIRDEGKEETLHEALRDKQEIWLGTLGLTYSDMGEYEEAIKYYEQAREIAEEIEDKVGEETWLGYMCLAYRTRGMHTEAYDYYKKALGISLNIADKDWKETWLEALGLKCSNLKNDEKALERYQQTLETLKEKGNKQRRGIQLGNFDLYPRGAR